LISKKNFNAKAQKREVFEFIGNRLYEINISTINLFPLRFCVFARLRVKTFLSRF